MTIELSWAAAGACAAVIGLVGKGVYTVISTQKAAHDTDVTAIKTTQKVLFDRCDKSSTDLQAYKLHVAETYVNREVLREALAPINRTLERIEDDLRPERNK